MLPNFLIIGAQKSGTTWLAEQLGQHPDVFMATGEVHFFDKDYHYHKGVQWYEQHFVAANKQKAVGEKTPDYLWANGQGVEGHLADVHCHIHDLLPDVKLIVVLRNPVNRAISAVNHIIRSGRVSPRCGIDDLLMGQYKHLVAGHGVLEYGRYHEQLQAYLKLFGREQLLVLIFEEDVTANPSKGLQKVCRFLGIDPDFPFVSQAEKKNANTHSRVRLYLNYYLPVLRSFTRPLDKIFPAHHNRPTKATVLALQNYYQLPNQQLFDFLQRDTPISWQYQMQTG
ncbi:MAG: sulfotransferase domain-containing protein [Ardenticatenaceae bacterium]|nr:sulfotransferase domain-containing protein [Ardenticatenaceae bacterium]